jgi:hypothetical protein
MITHCVIKEGVDWGARGVIVRLQVLGAAGFEGANGGVTGATKGDALAADTVLLGSVTKCCVLSGIHGRQWYLAGVPPALADHELEIFELDR